MTSGDASARPIVRCHNLVHVFEADGTHVAALRGVDLRIEYGENIALLGPSGAGKSTLLWHLAGLLRPSAGLVEVDGRDVAAMRSRELTEFRAKHVGVMLQGGSPNLLPHLDAVDNVVAAQGSARSRPRAKVDRARGLLADVGLSRLAHQRAGRLSGGEQQRLALAVALANSPRLLLADEPTSQLDHATGDVVVELIKRVSADEGTTLVVVTHDPAVSDHFARTVTIRDGRVGAEGHEGEDYIVVGADGVLHLPPDLLSAFPPGSLARAVRTDEGVSLERVDRPGNGNPPAGRDVGRRPDGGTRHRNAPDGDRS